MISLRICLSLCFCLLINVLCANSIDSLHRALQDHQRAGDGPAVCETHLQLAGAYFLQYAQDEALVHIDRGRPLIPADRHDLKHHFSYVEYMIVATQWAAYPSEQLALLDTAGIYLDSLGDRELQLGFWSYYGSLLINQGHFREAEQQYRKLEETCVGLQGGCSAVLLDAYSHLVVIQVSLGNFSEAYRYIGLSRKVAEGQAVGEALLSTYVEEAAILQRTGETDRLLPLLQTGLALAREAGNRRFIGRFHRLSAAYASQLGPRDSIPIWLDRARTALAGTDNADELLEVDMATVRYLEGEGEFTEMTRILKPYLSMCRSASPPAACRNICYFQAAALDTLNQLDSAAFYAQLAVSISKQFEDKVYLRNNYSLLSWIQNKQGNYQQAYDNLFTAHLLSDTIFYQDLEMAMANERTRQGLAAAEEAQLAAESRAGLLATQNRLWIGLAVALGALLLGGGVLLFLLQRARRKLSSTNRQLIELNATKDKFFSLVAHDIRSPLVALSGVGGQMQHYLDKNDSARLTRLSQRVEDTAAKLTNLLDNLLRWALLQTGMTSYKPESLPLNDLVRENIALYAETAEAKGITLRSEVSAGQGVFADPGALSTILRNLLSNAIKFTPQGGNVSLFAQSDGQMIRISVVDNGQGIAPGQMSNLFTLEKTTTLGTAGEKGSGLGLLLVKELTKLNRGMVELTSKPGKGTTFTISLPGAQ